MCSGPLVWKGGRRDGCVEVAVVYLETPSLLITDDDRALRETLRGLFEDRGFRALVACDGDEAIEIVCHEDVHLVVIDLHMPRMSGLEAIRHLRQVETTIPWILMSAGLDAQVVDEARQLEAASVLAKPVRCAELTGAVSSVLREVYGWSPER
ncbi:MAG: response regulator [Planctomycetales bacterium]|nr:response regulator [Planctomycetales bacterium]